MYIGKNYDTCFGAYNKYLIYKLDANSHQDISIGIIRYAGLYTLDDYFFRGPYNILCSQITKKFNGSVYHIITRGSCDHIVINIYFNLYGDILEIVSNMDKYKTMDIIKSIDYKYPETVYTHGLDKIKCIWEN